MDTSELELITADTRDLSDEIHADLKPTASEDRVIPIVLEEQPMETHLNSDASPEPEGFGDSLLDLSHYQTAPVSMAEDVILDIDFDSPTPETVHSAATDRSHTAFAAEAVATTVRTRDEASTSHAEDVLEWDGDIQTDEPDWGHPAAVLETAEPVLSANDQGIAAASEAMELQDHQPRATELPLAPAMEARTPVAGQVTLEQLSPEVIDAIAHRVVEQLSEKAVQEIAWEVVPQLAELLIKRKLEESK